MKNTDFRVDLLPSLHKLQIHAKRDALSTTLTGNWISKIKGHGIEFSGYRQYTASDDANMIDWKASVRSRKLLVKELQEEKNLNVFLLVDVSDTMLFGTTNKLKAEFVAEMCSSIAYAALRSTENVGLVVFSDHVKRYVEINQGMAQHALIIKVLSTASVYGGKKDFPKAAGQLLSIMKEGGLIIIVSDFIGVDHSWEKYLKIMAEKHDLICLMVRDPRDRRLPETGEFVLQDPSSGEKLVIDAADYHEPYKLYVEEEEKKFKSLLRRAKADFLSIETTENYTEKLVKFLMVHNKRVQAG
jgi:uncharacterized protein (DUF58 family)